MHSLRKESFKLSKEEVVVWILTIMLWVNLFVAFFPAHRGSILWNIISGEDAYTAVWLRILNVFNLGCTLFLVLYKRTLKYSIIVCFICLLWLSYILSKLVNLSYSDLILVVGIPIEYIVIYIILKEELLSKNSLKWILVLLGAWLVIPLILFFVGPIQTKLSFISYEHGRLGTYGGFALHRNYFGYYAGLVMLVFLFSNTKKWIKSLIIVVGFISIFVSTSRSAFLCLSAAISLFMWISYKRWRVPLLIAIVIGGMAYYLLSMELQLRTGDIMYTSDREYLMEAFTDSISQHPIMGKGSFTKIYSASHPDGAQAHNFILQIWSDYGIIALLFFILFWGAVYKYGNIQVKIFIAYLLLFGLFQPYLVLGVPVVFAWVNILLCSLSGGRIVAGRKLSSM